MFFIIDIIEYYFHPKYVVMRGVRIENRMIMFIGVNPVFRKDEYGNKVIRFSNVSSEYYACNIYKRIWTFNELRKWRKLIGKTTRCLRANIFTIERV